jgi:hypothetical protein
MAEEHARKVEGDAEDAGSATAEGEKATGAEAVERSPESKTQGILRDAIRRVMEEIERHEIEAKAHLQQAADLRKDLRESIAFLQKQGEKAPPSSVVEAPLHRKIAEGGAKEKAKDSAAGRKRARKK